jgi:hypothetical protein
MLPTILGNFVKGDPGLVWRGQYNSNTIYKIGDVVSFAGSSYVAIAAGANVPVSNTAMWELVAQAGTDGTGTGGGAVASVNGEIGDVVITPADIGAATIEQGAKADTAVQQQVGKTLSSNDFTTAEKSKLSTVQQGATLNDTDANLKNRANHIGTQSINTVDGLQSTLSAKVDVVPGKGLSSTDFTALEKTKLSGVATGATLNDTDANLKNRSNHTGTQTIATVEGLQSVIDSKVTIVAGKGLSTNDYTTTEKLKLAGLDASSYRGSFLSLVALQTALPSAKAGDYAFVDNAGSPPLFYIWDSTDVEWELSSSTSSPTATPAQIKSLYESNVNTNAFTDVEKAKLSTVALNSTSNDTDVNLKNRANHTGTQAISTVTGLQTSLDSKVATVAGKQLSTNDYTSAEQSKLSGIAPNATANSTDALLRDRSTHTGTQGVNTVTGLQSALDTKVNAVSGKGLSTNDYTTAEQSKLAGVAPGATANSTDSLLRDRSTHTGLQAISTVSGLQTALDGKISSVNGKTGSAITITATELGAATLTQGTKADTAVQTVNSKSGNSINLTPSDIGAATAAQGALANTAIQPAGFTKAAIGLPNVDNTSDANKPVSSLQATAINAKASINDSATSSSTATYSIDKILSLLSKVGPIITNDTDLATLYPASANQYRTAVIISGSSIKAHIISDGTNWVLTGSPTTIYSVAVTPANPGTPATATALRGMNISGAEYGENSIPGVDGSFNPGGTYFTPLASEFTYQSSRGMNITRIPVQIRRWFPTLGGELSALGKSELDLMASQATQANIQILLDFHDYAKGYINGAVRQLGSTEYPIALWASECAKVAAYIQNKSAFWGMDLINEPNGWAIPMSEFNYIAGRPHKQLMRDPQILNPVPTNNWTIVAPYSITNSGGTNGVGRLSWNATTAQFKDAVRHMNGAGNNGGDTLVAGQTYTVSFYYQSTATSGTHHIYFAAGDYASGSGVALGNIPLVANTSRTRVSLTFTMPAGQTSFYYNFNMQGFIGTGYVEDFNITEGSSLRTFVPWSSDGTVATNTVAHNTAIAAIRQAGYTGWVVVEADRASGIAAFGDNFGFNPEPWIVDPLNKWQYSPHYYQDHNYGGSYAATTPVDTNNGGLWSQADSDRIVPQLRVMGEILKKINVPCFVGEVGVPSDNSISSQNYRTDLDTKVYALADEYGWSVTYWAIGRQFFSITSIGPVNGVDNTAVLPIVVKHSPGASTTNPTTPATNSATYDGSEMTYNGSAVTYN